jgi:arylsulfatase A-like enzyme
MAFLRRFDDVLVDTRGPSGPPSAPERAMSGWFASRSESLKRGVVAWVAAMLLLGGAEWLVVLLLDGQALTGLLPRLLLLSLGIGNLAPYLLLALLPLLVIEESFGHLEARLGRRKGLLVVAATVLLVSLPYAISLGVFTFSGPAARTMAYHGLFVGLTSALVAATFAAAAAFIASGLLRRWRAAGIGLAALLAAGCVWVSRTTLANEYEKLHVFLAVWSLVFGALFGLLLCRRGHSPAPRLFWPALLLLPLSTLGAALIAGRAPAVAWVLWSRTGASRYVTKRIRLFEPQVAGDGSNAEMLLKPRLETEQTRAARQARAAQPAPNIVLFSVDGLRPDHVGAYGYKRHPTSPNIDRFAERGARFLNAFSSYPQTARFNTALLLGRYIAFMGRKHNVPASFQQKAITRLLHERGYHMLVKAWFEHSSQSSFDPRVYAIDTMIKKSRRKNDLEEPLEERLPVMEKHVKQARAAEFVPDPAFQFGSSRSDQYDSAIAGSDRWLEHVEKLMLAHADPARPTIWIILSDHGVRVDEEGRDLYASIVRVPLIIVAPGLERSVRKEPVDTSLDLAATVLDFAGIAPPETYDGISLLPLLEAGDPAGQMERRLIPLKRGRWKGAVFGAYKLLEFDDALSLVNTEEDPEEQHNIVDQYQGLARLMRQRADVELARRADSVAQGMHQGAAEPEDDEE